MSETLLKQIRPYAEEAAQKESLNLYDLEFNARQRTLKVFVDADCGVTVEQCAQVSRSLNPLLDDKEGLFPTSYHLEVSSPGIERHLKDRWHYEKAVGETVKVRTLCWVTAEASSKKTKVVLGTLEELNEESLVITKGNDIFNVSLDQVHRSNVVFSATKTKIEASH